MIMKYMHKKRERFAVFLLPAGLLTRFIADETSIEKCWRIQSGRIMSKVEAFFDIFFRPVAGVTASQILVGFSWCRLRSKNLEDFLCQLIPRKSYFSKTLWSERGWTKRSGQSRKRNVPRKLNRSYAFAEFLSSKKLCKHFQNISTGKAS